MHSQPLIPNTLPTATLATINAHIHAHDLDTLKAQHAQELQAFHAGELPDTTLEQINARHAQELNMLAPHQLATPEPVQHKASEPTQASSPATPQPTTPAQHTPVQTPAQHTPAQTPAPPPSAALPDHHTSADLDPSGRWWVVTDPTTGVPKYFNRNPARKSLCAFRNEGLANPWRDYKGSPVPTLNAPVFEPGNPEHEQRAITEQATWPYLPPIPGMEQTTQRAVTFFQAYFYLDNDPNSPTFKESEQWDASPTVNGSVYVGQMRDAQGAIVRPVIRWRDLPHTFFPDEFAHAHYKNKYANRIAEADNTIPHGMTPHGATHTSTSTTTNKSNNMPRRVYVELVPDMGPHIDAPMRWHAEHVRHILNDAAREGYTAQDKAQLENVLNTVLHGARDKIEAAARLADPTTRLLVFINSTFVHDPQTGTVVWRARPETETTGRRDRNYNHTKAGRVAGKLVNGYMSVSFGHDGMVYTMTHGRIVWILTHNQIPPDGAQIIHLDGDKTNTRASNLALRTTNKNVHSDHGGADYKTLRNRASVALNRAGRKERKTLGRALTADEYSRLRQDIYARYGIEATTR